MDTATLTLIFAKKESRRDTTNKAYASRLAGLTKRFAKFEEETYGDWTFLKKKDAVIHFLTKVPNGRKNCEGKECLPSPATQVGNFNPIIEYLLLIDEHVLAEEYNKVKRVIDDKVFKSYQKGSHLTKTQSTNIISYEDLVKYMEKIDEEITICEAKPLKTHLDEWCIEELKSLKILMRLYVLHPSRNEYATLRFIGLREYKKLKQPEFNYIVIGAAKTYISITNYKTSDKYGMKLNQITDKSLIKMLKDLKKVRDFEERDHLFYLTKTGTPWDNNNLCAVMTKCSKKLIGKNIGSTLLYKIVIQEAGLNYNEALKNDDMVSAVKYDAILAKYAKSRGHSQQIQKIAYMAD
mgnify:FL=1|tara:strand:+ start:197 stop:1249 length:1053 start_codon:yes stop_codon:yes gene_type:complete